MQLRSAAGIQESSNGWAAIQQWMGTTTFNDLQIKDAYGLPAVFSAIQLLSTRVGEMPLKVYRDDKDGFPVEATDTWQWDLLHRYPSTAGTPTDLKRSIMAALTGWGNAFILKTYGKKQVPNGKRGPNPTVDILLSVDPIHPRRVMVNYSGNPLVPNTYTVQLEDNRVVTLGSDRILHIRGRNSGEWRGLNPLEACSRALANGVSQERFAQAFYDGGAQLSGVLSSTEKYDDEDMRALQRDFSRMHSGANNAGNVAVLSGDWKWNALGVDPASAQWAEGHSLTITDIANIFGVPAAKLNHPGAQQYSTAADTEREFLASLNHWMVSIEEALNKDDGLFPPGSGLRCSFERPKDSGLALEMANYVGLLIQRGILTANEGRKKLGEPPHPDGNTLLQIPVGAGGDQTPTAPSAQAPKPTK